MNEPLEDDRQLGVRARLFGMDDDAAHDVGFRLRRRRRLPLTFNSTAMTDVIFILLIFFVSVSQVRTSSLELELPSVSAKTNAAKTAEATLLVVDIDREGKVFLDGKAIAANAVGTAAKAHGQEVRVRIRADTEARNGTVMEVVGSLAEVGIHAIEFAVEARSGGA